MAGLLLLLKHMIQEVTLSMLGNNHLHIDEKDIIAINLLQPEFFRAPHDETGLFDKSQTSKEFGHKLTHNGLTLSIRRKGKEALTIGKQARPKLSKLITRTDDIQIDSIKETAELKRDFKTD